MTYLFLKSLHILSFIAWMSGLLYLPRLLAYHAAVDRESDIAALFSTMEHRLLKIITTPAMMSTWFLGIALIFDRGIEIFSQGWFHAKLLLVTILTLYHVFLSRQVRLFARKAHYRGSVFYRVLNEIPFVIAIFIVFLVVLRPF